MHSLVLWSLPDVKVILKLHLLLIKKTIYIWSIRDNILIHYHHLQNLTISGWPTLSDLAFLVPFIQFNRQHLNLRHLRLVEGQENQIYIAERRCIW
jgi:hypothetical protein